MFIFVGLHLSCPGVHRDRSSQGLVLIDLMLQSTDAEPEGWGLWDVGVFGLCGSRGLCLCQ